MEFESVIEARRSIRKYLPQEVEAARIEKLLEMARLCQSAKNRQPWKFMVLKGEAKDRVADIMLSLFDRTDIEPPPYAAGSKYSAQIIKQAPVLLLAFYEREEGWEASDLLSIGAAIEHICLEVVNLGLGALWIRDTVFTEDEICAAVGVPQLKLVSAIAVGYAAEAPFPRPRKPMDELKISLIAMSDQGLCPLETCDFLEKIE